MQAAPVIPWRSVMPYGCLGIDDPADFRRAYRHRLHQRTPKILAELAELRADYDGERIVLLCFEDVRKPDQWCHRQLLSEWLTEHLGESIPELP